MGITFQFRAASHPTPGWGFMFLTRAYFGPYACVFTQKLENLGAGADAGLQLLVSS